MISTWLQFQGMGKLKQKAKTPNMVEAGKEGKRAGIENFKYLQQSKTMTETYAFADEN